MARSNNWESKTKVSIEFSHIYTDQVFGIEQVRSLELLRDYIGKIKKNEYSLTILIDDYNPKNHNLNLEDFIARLEILGGYPDFICFESELSKGKNDLINLITGKIKKEYEKYIERHDKLPCSFLLAIWYLMRLGILKMENVLINNINGRNVPFIANKLVNILPKKFSHVEKQASKIIKATKYRDIVKNIKYYYFD